MSAYCFEYRHDVAMRSARTYRSAVHEHGRPVEAREGAETVAQETGFELFRSFTSVVEEAVATGRMKGDPRAIATMLWAVGHGTISLLITFPFYPFGDPQAFVRRMCDFTIAGLADKEVEPLSDQPANC